jgi:predicted nucleotidyltransferase
MGFGILFRLSKRANFEDIEENGILNYKNLEFQTMSKKIKAILDQFKKLVYSEFSEKAIRIYVYGSCARGIERPDSDLDILVIVKKKSDSIEEKIREIAYQTMWDWNFQPLISIEIIEDRYFKDLERKGSSFHRAIQSEGILL